MTVDVADNAIPVVIAEDGFLARQAIEQILERAPDVNVMGICEDFESLLAMTEERRPKVVVTDIRMPPTGTDEGIRAARILRETHPEIGVVVISQFVEPQYAFSLLESGSAGRAYLLKERMHDADQLVEAIRAVAANDSLVDSKVVEALVEARGRHREPSLLDELTPRELEILAEIAKGKSNAAVASSLFLTKRAVEKHINSIFMKLELPDPENVSRRVTATLMFLGREQD